MFEFTFHHLYLASGAKAMTTGVRQPHTCTKAGVQHGLPFLDVDCLTNRFDGELIAHCGFPFALTRPNQTGLSSRGW